jgi:hypothetical protein
MDSRVTGDDELGIDYAAIDNTIGPLWTDTSVPWQKF